MKFQKILFSFFFTLFVIEVWADDDNNIPMTFIGLKGERGMGHTGYVHVSTDSTVSKFELSGCKNLEVNDTMCRFNVTTSNNEVATLLLHAWAAITLRENILSILGYLLHQSKIVFNESVESSLKLVYGEVRKNNIKILELMPRFRAIMRLNKGRRSVALFRALQIAMPSYCRSALEELVRIFYKVTNRVINSTLDNLSIELGTYLMANIDMKISQYLRTKIMRRPYDRGIGNLFGREYAIFFSAIHTGKLILTQPVLAILISITRFKELSANEMEDLSFLIDALLLNKIPGWLPNKSVDVANINDPYILINKMMKVIANHTAVDPTIKSIAANFQNHLMSGYIINRTKPMINYFGTPDFNSTMILEVLEGMEPIPEVKMLFDMIDNRTINLSYALKGFNRYHYDTPDKLLLAFVRRIQIRVPMDEVAKDNIQNIILHLLGMESDDYNSNDGEDTRTRRGVDVINISEAYSSRSDGEGEDIDVVLTTKCDTVDGCTSTLVGQPEIETVGTGPYVELRNSESSCPTELSGPSLSSWLKSLDAPVNNFEPSSLVANVSTLLAMFMNEPMIKNCVNNTLNNQTDSESCTKEVTLITDLTQYDSSISNNSSAQPTVNGQISIFNGTKKNLLKQILKEMLGMEQVCTRMVIYYEVMRVYCILVHGIGDHKPTTLATDLLLDHQRCGDIIKKLSRIVSEPFRKLLNQYDPMKKSHFLDLKAETITNRRFLMKLCKKLLALPSVKQNDELFNEIILFLHSIQDLPMTFTDVMDDMWKYSSSHELDTHSIFDYLTKAEALHGLGEDFDIGRYPTNGRLLKAMLDKISKNPLVKQDKRLSESIMKHSSLIECTDHGADSLIPTFLAVEPGHVFIPPVTEAANRARIDSKFQQTASNMWQWYTGDVDSLIALRSWNASSVESRAQLIEGLLDDMESNVDRDYNGIKKDIQTMRSAILRAGNETAPVIST